MFYILHKSPQGREVYIFFLLADTGSESGKIITGYKALCQEQKHQGIKILFVIIVCTIALKA